MVTSIRPGEVEYKNIYTHHIQQITSHEAYQGQLTGIETEEMLRGHPTGTYLLRNGEKEGMYYLSWVTDSEKCHYHHQPFSLFNNAWIYKNFDTSTKENLNDLIPIMMHLSEKPYMPFIKKP